MRAGDKIVRSSSVFLPLHRRARLDGYDQAVIRIVCMPSLSALIVSACLSGCVVAGLFVLADASARTQLQQAVIASRAPQVDRKPAAALSRTKAGSPGQATPERNHRHDQPRRRRVNPRPFRQSAATTIISLIIEVSQDGGWLSQPNPARQLPMPTSQSKPLPGTRARNATL